MARITIESYWWNVIVLFSLHKRVSRFKNSTALCPSKKINLELFMVLYRLKPEGFASNILDSNEKMKMSNADRRHDRT